MNNQFIQRVIFDWNRIDNDSYLKGIEVFKEIEKPILLGIPDADIYCFDNGRIHLCEYEDTESYQVTEVFINNRQMLLDRLLTDYLRCIFSVASRHAFETYWLPRSEWIISGKSVLRQAFALLIVSITVDTSIVSARVQAMIFRAYKSITQLRYTKPSCVQI